MTFRNPTFYAVFAMLAAGTALSGPAAAQADTAAGDAVAHNTAYEEGLARSLTTPETMGELLQCSALWDRWSYIVESAADPAFVNGLREELSAANAASRKLHWQRLARREMLDDDDTGYFDKMRGKAETQADEEYADYASGAEGAMESMMGWLASC
tara:strand:- start:120 stop:587 length:468 start_codon:yes stop_codon:yes gene_type:complete